MHTWVKPKYESFAKTDETLNYHLQLKSKRNVEGSGLEIQRGGSHLTWRWMSKWWVNKYRTKQRRWDME